MATSDDIKKGLDHLLSRNRFRTRALYLNMILSWIMCPKPLRLTNQPPTPGSNG